MDVSRPHFLAFKIGGGYGLMHVIFEGLALVVNKCGMC